MKTTRPLVFTILVLIVAAAFTLDVGTGSVYIPPSEFFAILLGHTTEQNGWESIVWLFRLPKALAALAGGAALATSGLLMQTLFKNPLAGPSVLGITSGASLGVALVMLGSGSAIARGAGLIAGLGLGGNLMLIVASALGATLVLLIILGLAGRVKSVMTLLIVGILGSFALSSIVSVLIYFSRPEMVQAYLAWTFGSFSSVTWLQIKVFVPLCLFLVLIVAFLGKPLNVLLLGETYAKSMGLDHMRVRLIVLSITAILVGVVTAFCGPIGFIGIAVPHLGRAVLRTADHRMLLPATALLGAAMALLADMVAQLPGHQAVLPLNAVTSIIGSPVIIWFILSRGKRAVSQFE